MTVSHPLADVYIDSDDERPFVLRSDTLILAPVEGHAWCTLRVFERVR